MTKNLMKKTKKKKMMKLNRPRRMMSLKLNLRMKMLKKKMNKKTNTRSSGRTLVRASNLESLRIHQTDLSWQNF